MTETEGPRGRAAGKAGARKGKPSDGTPVPTARTHVECALAELPKSDHAELYRFWKGDSGATPPSSAKKLITEVLALARDPEHVGARVGELAQRVRSILDLLLAAPRYECTFADLKAAKSIAYLSTYDLEAGLAALVRRGLAVEGASSVALTEGARAFRVPADLGDTILLQRRAARRGIFDFFTLRGHLDRLYDDPERAKRTTPARVRQQYKMYSSEAACVARIERLPDGLRAMVEKVILEFGGILPRSFFDRMETELPHWNGRRWARILEESLVGTVQQLDLTSYGIAHSDETLVVFNEVALAWLKRVAVPGDPDRPHDEAGLGVDLVSNISRFLAYIIDNQVRFTVRGEIFKTTEKRILQDLIPNPGRELERGEVLSAIYRFARARNLIEPTGERTFALTAEGRDWEPQTLDEKLKVLLDAVLEETGLGGEYAHQMRMRRLYLRMLRRIEPGTWYDIMYIPFLSRNQYLCSLDELAVDEWFEQNGHGGASGGEDLQRLAWNLVGWVRKRLYLLGMVDLGYDRSGRPVAMRLTATGARLLGLRPPEGDLTTGSGLVVTPDFEVVLFPSGDDAELVHDLDRFCEREKDGHLKHFRISDRSVHRALVEGMSLARMTGVLERNARTPVPQNVLYSLRDWANRSGLLYLDDKLRVRATDPDLLARFSADPGVRPYVARGLDEHSVQMKNGKSPTRLRSLLRDLDYLVELE